LIMGAVDAIGEIARGVRDADSPLSHKIRLSDFSPASTHRKGFSQRGCHNQGQN
jgi:hypothetical protein